MRIWSASDNTQEPDTAGDAIEPITWLAADVSPLTSSSMHSLSAFLTALARTQVGCLAR